jgi:hypothetical protein
VNSVMFWSRALAPEKRSVPAAMLAFWAAPPISMLGKMTGTVRASVMVV